VFLLEFRGKGSKRKMAHRKYGKSDTVEARQSGNPAGKPVGTRHAFSQGFVRDYALVWGEEGIEAIRKVAKKSPETFVGIAAKLIPAQVSVDLQSQLPGNLSLEDWSVLRE
jgi:hypothetical protein